MLTPITLPPGVYRQGTVEQSKARFYDCNLVRWNEGGLLAQMPGWESRSATVLTGKPRAALLWQGRPGGSGARVTWLVVGTHSKLYVQKPAGTTTDITPAGFTAGRADETGSGDERLPASIWSFDLWNDRVVGTMAEDGKVYIWDLDTANDAVAVTNAPTDCEALLVTAEGILMTFKDRRVKWSDQGDNTIWTPSDTNQARSLELVTSGTIQAGCKVPGGVLLVTTNDAHLGSYLGFPLVYGFRKAGDSCGMVSRGALASTGQIVAWMGPKGFFRYDGFVQPLPCDIADLVFGDINTEQLSKVTAGHNSQAGELWWNYCSAGSDEIDRQAIWNYRLNVWYPCALERACLADGGTLRNPVMVSPDGHVFNHETGWDYEDAVPFAETGPMRIGNGDRRMEVQRIVPDERSDGDFEVTFYTRDFPTDTDATQGPYTFLDPREDVMFQAGRIRVRYDFTGEGAVVGDFMLDLIPGDPLP